MHSLNSISQYLLAHFCSKVDSIGSDGFFIILDRLQGSSNLRWYLPITLKPQVPIEGKVVVWSLLKSKFSWWVPSFLVPVMLEIKPQTWCSKILVCLHKSIRDVTIYDARNLVRAWNVDMCFTVWHLDKKKYSYSNMFKVFYDKVVLARCHRASHWHVMHSSLVT